MGFGRLFCWVMSRVRIPYRGHFEECLRMLLYSVCTLQNLCEHRWRRRTLQCPVCPERRGTDRPLHVQRQQQRRRQQQEQQQRQQQGQLQRLLLANPERSVSTTESKGW